MVIIILMMLLLLFVCVYCSYTDLRYNIISNKVLITVACAGIILDIIYYSNIYTTGIITCLINVGSLTLIAIILYSVHIWAAGDSKFLIVISLLIPSEICYVEDTYLYAFMIPVFAFSAGFVFLTFDTIWCLIKKKRKLSVHEIKTKFVEYFKNFVINCIYILTLTKIEDYVFLRTGFQLGIGQIVINICALILISHIKIFRNYGLIGCTLGGSLLFSIGTGVWMINVGRMVYYGIIALFMVLQILIGEFNYAVIETDKIKKGMVISFMQSALFAHSRVAGLPGLSTEDMRSRITQEEADAIRRWGASKNGTKRITIVRKIPFAIFIFIGTICYFALGYFLR